MAPRRHKPTRTRLSRGRTGVLPKDDRLLTVVEVAAYLGISRDSVFTLLRTGALKSVLIGKRGRRITRAQLNAYVTGLAEDPPGRR